MSDGPLQEWVNAIKSGDPKKVTDLYAKDAILLGTFSNKERIGHTLILEYFENLLKSPVEVQIVSSHHVQQQSIRIGKDGTEYLYDVARNTGLYNFVTGGKTINARFTFVYDWENGFKIVSHHSSVMPET